MIQSGVEASGLSTEQINQITSMVNEGNYFYVPIAMSLYKQINPDFEYDEPIYIPAESSARMSSASNSIKSEKSGKTSFTVFPNPAHDYLNIDYSIVESYSTTSVEITDVTGKIVLKQQLKGGINQELIHLTDLANGTYMVLLKGDNLIISTQKLSIINK